MTKANSNPWQPAALDAEFSPQVAELLRADHGRRELSSRVRSRDEGLRTAVKKHLLALGWTILSTPNAAMLTRLRYKAPGDGGRSYCSLPDLVVDRAASPHLIVDSDRAAADDGDPQFQQQHNNEPPPPPAQTKDDSRREQEEGDDEEEDDSSREQEEGDDEEEDDRDWEQEEGHDEEEDDSSREQEEGDDEAEDKDQKKDAVIAEYIALMAKNYRASGPRANRLRDSAKSHLLASGWTFWMKLKSSGKEELRYKAPTGRSYISLHTACQAFMATASASNGSKIDRRRRVHVTPAAVLRAVRPTGKKRELSELIGDDAVKDVTMNRCTTIRKKKEMVRADGTQVTKKSITTTTLTRTRSRREDQARVLRPNSTGTASACQRRSRTLLSVLIDRGILVPRDKVTYWAARDGPAAKYGFITGEGIIRCTCCNKTFTVAELEAHATGGIGTDDRREAWARVFLIKDGRSLSQCLVELMRRDVAAANRNGNGGVRVKEKCSEEEGDSVCSVCIDGGELLLCDKCPSAFHHACVGLQATPEGDWCCPLCRCGVCGGSDSHLDDTAEEGFTDKTIIYCEQCEREYHVGCVRRRGGSDSEEESAAEWCRRLSEEQEEEWRPWLCSPECGEVFRHLQGLAALSRARSIPTTVEGVSLSTLRRRRRRRHMSTATRWQQEEEDAAEHGQLCAALDVLHECFDDMKEPRTQTDLTADIVFNRESGLRRLNFRGYYVVGLEKAGELITVGTLRVFGKQVAELPLVGTRFAHRRRGMCHLLVTELEKMLRRVGVRRLVLPAVPELLPMWTASLGFHAMTHSDVMEMAAEHAILSFQGTTMCQKTLLA